MGDYCTRNHEDASETLRCVDCLPRGLLQRFTGVPRSGEIAGMSSRSFPNPAGAAPTAFDVDWTERVPLPPATCAREEQFDRAVEAARRRPIGTAVRAINHPKRNELYAGVVRRVA